jgi:hypothetical protein
MKPTRLLTYLFLCIGISCIIIGILLLISDDDDELFSTSRSNLRTMSEIEPSILAYFSGDTLQAGDTTWSSTVNDVTASIHEQYTLTIHPYSGNYYLKKNTGSFGWMGQNFYLSAGMDPLQNGASGMTYAASFTCRTVGGPIFLKDFQIFQNNPFLNIFYGGQWIGNKSPPYLDSNGDPYGWTNGAELVYFLSFQFVPGGDTSFDIYIFDDNGDFVAGCSDTWVGVPDAKPSGNGWHRFGMADNAEYDFHGALLMDTHITQEEAKDLTNDLLNRSKRPRIEFGTQNFYIGNYVNRTATIFGQPTTFIATGVPDFLSFNSSACQVYGTPTAETSGTYTVEVDGVNVATVTYTVHPAPIVQYREANYVHTILSDILIIPEALESVTITGITPDLPPGLSLALVDDEPNNIIRGTVQGVVSIGDPTETYTLQYDLPQAQGNDAIITLSGGSKTTFTLAVYDPGANSLATPTLFSYGTTKELPLVCLVGLADRAWNGNSYRSFLPDDNAAFSNFQVTPLPDGLSVDGDTGEVLGIPTESVVTTHYLVTAVHTETETTYSKSLYLKVSENMTTLMYASTYSVIPDQSVILAPEAVDGEAITIELVGAWPEGTTVSPDGTITLPADHNITESVNNLQVLATNLNGDTISGLVTLYSITSLVGAAAAEDPETSACTPTEPTPTQTDPVDTKSPLNYAGIGACVFGGFLTGFSLSILMQREDTTV